MSWPANPQLDEERWDVPLNDNLTALKAASDTQDATLATQASTISGHTATLATHTADLASQGARVTKQEARNPEVWSNYRTKSNGALPANFDSGQQAVVYTPTALPAIISNGAMGMQQNGVLKATYVTADLDGPVTRFGSTFFFSGGTGGITATATHIISPATYVHGVDFACHFVVGPTNMGWQVRTAPGSAVTVYSYFYPSQLSLDTEYSVEAQINGSVVTLVAPDGTLHQFSDSAIATNNGGFMTWEPYQDNLSTDPVVWFREVWADSAAASTLRGNDLKLARLKQLVDLRQPRIKAAQYAPASDTTLTLSGTNQEINSALRLTVTIPPSGLVLFEVQCYLTLSSGLVFCGVTTNANLSGGYPLLMAATTDTTGMKYCQFLFTGTPGATATYYFPLFSAAGTAVVSSYGPLGRYSIVKATPL